ncbi:MAG TPA: choice-of-anchor E domain-containing protein [Gemmataceae bacterium]|nr:choice-of-anchor E domain-containing protein [Gemmataceae bacterium]
MIHSLSRLLTVLGGSSRRTAARRRTAAPRIEFLESRLTPSTIAGVVYNDLAAAGLYQTGDPLYANMPINLLNGSGAVIGSTATDGAGHYSFSVDQTISTAPTTQEQDASFGPSPTDAPQTVQIAKFDPSLGTLTSVQIEEMGTIASTLQVDNLDPSQATVQAQIQGDVLLQGAALPSPLTANIQAQESASLAATDGTIGFTSASAHNFGAKDAQGSQSLTLNASSNDLSAFIGAGKLTLNAEGNANVSLSGPANLLAMIQSTVSGQVKVIYTYTPSNALKPGQYTVVETKDPPATTPGTDSSNGVPVAVGTPADVIPVTLPPGGDSLHNDFGKLTAAEASGYVYLDNNSNGVFDVGDAPIPGAAVTISKMNAGGTTTIVGSTTTGADGSYSFTVPSGNYIITQTAISGLLRDANNVGSLGGTAAPGALTVSLPAGGDGVNYDFGYVAPPIPPSIPPAIPTPPPAPPAPPPLVPTPPVLTKFDFIGSTAWDGDF